MVDRPFKDFIDRDVISDLAQRIAATGRPFRRRLFTRRATGGLEDLELKARVRQVAAALHDALDDNIEGALGTLVSALPPMIDEQEKVTSHFGYWPFLQFVEDYAAVPQHFDAAMAAIYEMTQRFSAEFAVRPLLDAEPVRTLAVLQEWTSDSSVHVRRLCSEGTRPRLPWGRRLSAFVTDPTPTLPLLEALADDAEEYVRRSVANHVNDVSKDHPDLAVELCTQWLQQPHPRSGEPARQRLVRHALRGLVKGGNPNALALLGYRPARLDAEVRLGRRVLQLGDAVAIELHLASRARRPQPLLIDYAVHYKKADGSLRPKVFKWTERELGAGERLVLERRHVFRRVTTRTHYPGEHRLEILINGRSCAAAELRVD